MFFDERPKTRKQDLYDTEQQLTAFLSALGRGDPLVLILGLRRTGKTSLLLTGLVEAKLPSIIVDLRSIADKPYATKKELFQLLESSVNRFLSEEKSRAGKILEKLKGVKGVQVMGTGVTISWAGKQPLQITDIFTLMNEAAAKNNYRLVIGFDEAQELGKVAGFNMQRVLAHVYDYCHSISIVLTGSAIGLLRDFVGTNDPHAPLYGRAMTEISLDQLRMEQSRDFLERGFKQAGLKPGEERLEEALAKLDGIIGWLTLYGSICRREGISANAIEKVREIGKAMAKSEFQNFLGPRRIASERYNRIMKRLASGPASWSELKGTVESLEGRTINDRTITELTTALVKAGFLKKEGEFYKIGDPLIAEAFR